jgi:hypothetical protein
MEFFAFIDQFKILQENILLKRLVIILVYAVLAKAVDIFVDRVLSRIASKTRIKSCSYLLDCSGLWNIAWIGCRTT